MFSYLQEGCGSYQRVARANDWQLATTRLHAVANASTAPRRRIEPPDVSSHVVTPTANVR